MQPQITADGRSSSTQRKGRRVLKPISDDVLMCMYSRLKVSDADVTMATAALRRGPRQRVREFWYQILSEHPLSSLLSAFLASFIFSFVSDSLFTLLFIPSYFLFSLIFPLISFVFPFMEYIPLLSFFYHYISFFFPSPSPFVFPPASLSFSQLSPSSSSLSVCTRAWICLCINQIPPWCTHSAGRRICICTAACMHVYEFV